jgi:hypothetical protein
MASEFVNWTVAFTGILRHDQALIVDQDQALIVDRGRIKRDRITLDS